MSKYKALIPCVAGMNVTTNQFIPEGYWAAVRVDQVIAIGAINKVEIPKEADLVMLNQRDYDALLERIKGKGT